jgi:hypothetical protein
MMNNAKEKDNEQVPGVIIGRVVGLLLFSFSFSPLQGEKVRKSKQK